MIAVFPGSFKPPHAGHFSIVENLLKHKDITEVIVLISQKPKPINNKLINMTSVIEARKEARKYIRGIDKMNLPEISKKIKELTLEGKIPSITQDESYEIWKLYLSLLSKTKQKKVKLMKSRAKSPVQNGFVIKLGKDEAKKGNKIVLVKSAKNGANHRFDFYDMTIGKKNIVTLEIPELGDLSSTNMRNLIEKHKYDQLKDFVPKKTPFNKFKRIFDLA